MFFSSFFFFLSFRITKLIKKIEKQLNDKSPERQISPNQLGCKKFTYASKEGLLQGVLIQTYLNKKKSKWVELYYDVSKAYDSVNHKWLIKCLQYFNITKKIIIVIESMMNMWKLEMYHKNTFIGNIKVNNGILQVDSFSPLLITMSIDCVSKTIEKYIQPIKIEENGMTFELSHIFYMDDLKNYN